MQVSVCVCVCVCVCSCVMTFERRRLASEVFPRIHPLQAGMDYRTDLPGPGPGALELRGALSQRLCEVADINC